MNFKGGGEVNQARKQSEQILQAQCEHYLDIRNIMYIHLRTFWEGRPVPGRRGWPDLMIFPGIGKTFFIELKVGKNALTKSQKEVFPMLENKGYDVFVIRSFGSFMELIDGRQNDKH